MGSFTKEHKRAQVFGAGTFEKKISLPQDDIDLAAGGYFTKTHPGSGTLTLTVSNVPPPGYVGSFILEITNGGAGTGIAFGKGFNSIKWSAGSAPTLTAAGVDILSGYTHDGGVTWRLILTAKDSK